MRLLVDKTFLMVFRNSEASSPYTIRPLQSTTRTPSFSLVASVSLIRTPLRPAPNTCWNQTTLAHRGDAPWQGYAVHHFDESDAATVCLKRKALRQPDHVGFLYQSAGDV